MERELVFRLRRPAAGHRRLGAAGSDAQREHHLDQRAAVRAGHADHRTAGLRRHRRDRTHLWTPTEPLQTYAVTVRGSGQAYDDPAALLRGEPGRPVEATMDLIWTTAGVPYQYRITPRYEIPCTVSGTVTVDGREYAMNGVPGQRDHSWGVRDWWSMDWVWSALHLDDGTHVHGVDLRIPGAPPDRYRLRATGRRGAGRTAGRDGSRRRSPTTICRCRPRSPATRVNSSRRSTSVGMHRSADIARRPDQPVPAGVGDGHHRRRPHRRRLGGMEPQPAVLR